MAHHEVRHPSPVQTHRCCCTLVVYQGRRCQDAECDEGHVRQVLVLCLYDRALPRWRCAICFGDDYRGPVYSDTIDCALYLGRPFRDRNWHPRRVYLYLRSLLPHFLPLSRLPQRNEYTDVHLSELQ